MQIQPLPKSLAHDLCGGDFYHVYSLSGSYPFVKDNLTQVRFNDRGDRWLTGDTATGERDTYRVSVAENTAKCATCVRDLRYEERLYGSEKTGRVAYRFLIWVTEARRGQGIATTICEREEASLFSKWRADEVQVFVDGQGFLTWTRPRFGYEIAPAALKMLRAECKRRFGDGPPSPECFEKMSDFPPYFWEYARDRGFQATFFKRLDE